MDLFAYGTLVFPEVWRAVAGRDSPSEPASVTGFAVYQVRGGVYPVMLEAGPKAVVRGLVYRDVDDVVLIALDAYESNLYDRVRVVATLESGVSLDVQAYVLPSSRWQHSSGKPWDAATFARDHLKEYLNGIRE